MEYNGIKVLVSEGAFKEYKNEKLKDIMEYLEDPDIYVEEHGYCYKRLSLGDDKLLLDYITNLQNEIFDLKDTIQNKNDCIGAYECIIEDRDKRIDKAVEYIENDIDLTGINGFEKLLNILRGDE